MTPWEMSKEFNFDHTNKWYMHNLIIINKRQRTCKIVDFAVTADYRIKLKECEKKDKYLDLARELKKYGTYRCNWCVWNSN